VNGEKRCRVYPEKTCVFGPCNFGGACHERQELARAFNVGDRVRALVACDNDLTDDGMGIEHCAQRGDVLIVRRFSSVPGRLVVSHEDVTDGRGFLVDPHEVERIGG
jgi:hypothetical protein